MKTKEASLLTIFKNGIITENPTLIQILGMCPTLATTTSIQNAIGMGLAATAVLVFSNMVIAMLRKFIPNKIRIASFIVIIAGFVTIVDLLIKAYIPALSSSLGLFIPLIVVNCIILARAESFAAKNKVLPSVVDGIGMGLGFTGALIIMAFIRELLGNGTLYGFHILPFYKPALLMILPPGGFLALGCIIAVTQWLSLRKGGSK